MSDAFRHSVAAGLLMLAAAMPAHAQVSLGAGVEATTDERRRGLSWSGGRASVAGDARVTIGAIEGGVRVAALRGSERHDGADAAADIDLGTGWNIGPVRARARGTWHAFSDARGPTDYGEIGGDLGYTLGPAQVTGGVSWAPDQDAIGGSNLYLFLAGNVGVPGTPWTVLGAVGRSSGSVADPGRAARLRPAGTYADWQLGIEHVLGPLTLGLDYVGTDIDRRDVAFARGDGRHSGDRILARARLAF